MLEGLQKLQKIGSLSDAAFQTKKHTEFTLRVAKFG